MNNFKELNTREMDETYNDAYIYFVKKNDVTLYSCLPSPLNFYQWYDLG